MTTSLPDGVNLPAVRPPPAALRTGPARTAPPRLHRRQGTIHVDHDSVTVALKTRTYSPVLLDVGYQTLEVPIPWWNNRRLRFTFPPR